MDSLPHVPLKRRPPPGLHVATADGYLRLDDVLVTLHVQRGERVVLIGHSWDYPAPSAIEVTDGFGVAATQEKLAALVAAANRYRTP